MEQGGDGCRTGCLGALIVILILLFAAAVHLSTQRQLATLQGHPPAEIELEHPAEVRGVFDKRHGLWVQWDLPFVLTETTGGLWVACEAQGYYLSPAGVRFMSRIDEFHIARRVNGGERVTEHFTLTGLERLFCGGTLVFTWSFTDAAGNVLEPIETRTKLLHDCPGR